MPAQLPGLFFAVLSNLHLSKSHILLPLVVLVNLHTFYLQNNTNRYSCFCIQATQKPAEHLVRAFLHSFPPHATRVLRKLLYNVVVTDIFLFMSTLY